MQQEQATETAQGAVVVLEDYSVILAKRDALQSFFTDGKNLDGLYLQIEKMAKGLVADTSTKDGIAQIKSCARQIASVKKKVDDIGKDVVADLKKLPGIIDNNRKTFRERMEDLQDEVRRPVTEIENREDEIDGIKGIHLKLAMADSAQIRNDLEYVKAIPLTEEKWHESLEKATKAVKGEISALELLLGAAEKREADARRLKELEEKQAEAERIIREQKIKEEAERRAREEAEARAAAEKARLEREKQEAERKAAEAERRAQEAKERERKAMEVQNGNACSAKGPESSPSTAKHSKWTPEMKAVNNAIVKSIAGILPLFLAGFTDSGYELAAREIVKAIVNGKINNLKVEY